MKNDILEDFSPKGDENKSENKKITPEKIVWEGNVPPGYHLESTGGSVTITGNLGKGAIAKSKFGLTIGGDAEEKSNSYAENGPITLKNAKDGATIESPQLFVKLKSAGNNVTIKADTYIKVEAEIGSDCKISASSTYVEAKKIGARTEVTCKKGEIFTDIIGEDARVIGWRVKTKRVEERAYVRGGLGGVIIQEYAALSADIDTTQGGPLLRPTKPPVSSSHSQNNPIEISVGTNEKTILSNISFGLFNMDFSKSGLSTSAETDQKSESVSNKDNTDLATRHKSKPFSTSTVMFPLPNGQLKKITVCFYESLEKTGTLSDIATNIPYGKSVLEVTWGTVKKSFSLEKYSADNTLNFYEEDFGSGTRVLAPKPTLVEEKERYNTQSHSSSSQSSSLSSNESSSSQSVSSTSHSGYSTKSSSVLGGLSSSHYSASSPATFKSSESKREVSSQHPPTVADLNNILGHVGLVTSAGEAYSYKFIIDFNPSLLTSYESIVTKKLLIDIPNVTITEGGNAPRLCIPHEVYNQFIKNVTSALKVLSESTTNFSYS